MFELEPHFRTLRTVGPRVETIIHLLFTMLIENPHNYGKRLIPQILDNLALAEPDRIIYTLASFPNATAQFRTVNARTFAQAVDKTAWWLQNQIRGPNRARNGATEDFNKKILPIGYIGPRRLRR